MTALKRGRKKKSQALNCNLSFFFLFLKQAGGVSGCDLQLGKAIVTDGCPPPY